MKQIFHPYDVWEGYLNGMYDQCKEGREDRVKVAVWLLGNTEELRASMERVTDEWVKESEHVLSDLSINHRAWLGQSACNIYGGVKEDETREAWSRLTERQRKEANAVADSVDKRWRDRHEHGNGSWQLSFTDVAEEWR